MIVQISNALDGQVFTPNILPFEEIHNITSSSAYSSMIFSIDISKGTNRRGLNVEAIGNILIYDIDDGMLLDEAIEISKAYRNLIATSRNHQKDKKGLTCDRYRVIIPLYSNTNLTINIPKDDYPQFYTFVANFLGFNSFDKATKDIARFYYPNPNQLVNYSNSDEVLEFELLYNEFIEHQKRLVIQRSTYTPQTKKGNRKDLLSNELPLNTMFETRNGTLISWNEATAQTTPVRCILKENHKNGDKNPSAFIVHDVGSENPRFFCSGCGASFWKGNK